MNYIKELLKIPSIQEKIEQIKKSSHAIILVSKDEVLLEEFSKLLILFDVCQFVKKPCFDCVNCQKVINNNAIDVEIFGKEKSIVVSDSSKIVADSFVVPLEFEKKYFLLNNFDKATEQAQNKLLKIIEEPQKFDKFILTTLNLNAILPTIQSRAEIYHLSPLTNDDLFIILKSSFLDKEKLNKAINFSNGNLTKALKIIQDDEYFNLYSIAEKLVMFMHSSANMLEYASEILKYKGKTDDFLDILSEIFTNLLKTKSKINLTNNRENQFKIIAEQYSEIAIIKIIEQINIANSKLKSKISNTEIIDNLLLKILEIKYLCK